MKRILLIIFFLSSTAADLISQNNRLVDSLKTLLKKERVDSTKINLLLHLSKMTELNMPDSALSCSEKALHIIEKELKKASAADLIYINKLTKDKAAAL